MSAKHSELHRDMSRRSTRDYKVGDKVYEVSVMVYRCGQCGNELHEDDMPKPPEPIDGTRRTIKFSIAPVCHHALPYTMQRVPKGSPK